MTKTNPKIEVTTPALEREKVAYQFAQALEQGDFDTMARIHAMAETDPALEAAITALQEDAAAAEPEVVAATAPRAKYPA